VDEGLVQKKFTSDEEVYEMNNGCICCTVRGDLINILEKLSKRKSKLDAIIIECTGLADPGPVAQTFFVDEAVKQFARLDGIVTLVDAKHIEQHLDEVKEEGVENEAIEQVALADRLLLNKTDLMPAEHDLQRIEARLKSLNKFAPIIRTHNSAVALEHVFGINAFELERVLERDPAFLGIEPTHSHEHGHSESAPEHGHSGCDDLSCTDAAHEHGHDQRQGHEHGHDDRCDDPDGAHESHPTKSRHSTKVSSVGFLTPGELNMEKTNAWISALLQDKGADIYRMKGVLSMARAPAKFVYQGVHMMFKGEFAEPWMEGEERINRLIFIGKNLDRAELKTGFESCLDATSFIQDGAQAASLRFKVGDLVECRTGPEMWSRGEVVKLLHREDHFPPGMTVPYQVKLQRNGELIYTQKDLPFLIRRAAQDAR